MAKKPAAKQTAAATLLHSLLGAVAEALANDEQIAKVAADQYGLHLGNDDAAEGDDGDDGDDDGDEFDDVEEEEEEAPRGNAKGKQVPRRGKKVDPEDLAAAIQEGDLSCLDDADEDLVRELAALTKVATAAKLRRMDVDAIIDALYEKFGDEDDEAGDDDEFDDDDDADDNVDEFDAETADMDELREFAKDNGIVKAAALRRDFAGNDKKTIAKLRKLVIDWIDEQEGEEEDDFGDDDFDDE